MKLNEILEEAYDEVSYDPRLKVIIGSVKTFLNGFNITQSDIKTAVDKFKVTALFKKLEDKIGRCSSSAAQLKHGAIVFGVTGSSSPAYVIGANGQIRKYDNLEHPSRLPSPNPFDLDADDDPVKLLLKIYSQAGEALLKKNLKSVKEFEYCNRGLTKLPDGIPEEMKVFYCSGNKLVNLVGAPKIVTVRFEVQNNKLTSLEGFPKQVGIANISGNKLNSFDGISNVDVGNLIMSENKLTSLHNIHKAFKNIDYLDVTKNKITSCVLGLLKIGLKRVSMDNAEVVKIINSHLKNGSDVFDCQAELIDAGYEEYAKL